ncbi:MAG: sigma-70 family RNA polymerase sigma factor [Chitinophagaceae bacterium]|nr:sigma-70 family RNA polymerase sigma factor [Chitinophagaceae bacterium]
MHRQVNTFDDEKALLRGLSTHDPLAIEMIYRQSFGPIQSFVIKNNGFSDDARDVFQEAMVILFENAQSESFELTCRIRTYLYSICRRLWLKKIEREKRFYTGSFDTLNEIVPVEDDLEMHEKKDADLQLMDEALGKIGEPCKSLLEAFYIQKKSMPEIAESFGYTNADNAKTQKYKCLMRLKKLFFSRYKNED